MSRFQTNGTGSRHGLSADEARALCDLVLSFAEADNTRVNVNSGWLGFTRTAINRITTAGSSTNTTVQITSVFGKRIARVTTNNLERAGLEQAVKDSEALARISPEDPEYMPELEQQEYLDVGGYYDSTGELAPETRAESMSLALDSAKASEAVAAGFMDVRAGANAVANSNGLFAYHPSTGVASTLTVRTPDGQSSAGPETRRRTGRRSSRSALLPMRSASVWIGGVGPRSNRENTTLCWNRLPSAC